MPLAHSETFCPGGGLPAALGAAPKYPDSISPCVPLPAGRLFRVLRHGLRREPRLEAFPAEDAAAEDAPVEERPAEDETEDEEDFAFASAFTCFVRAFCSRLFFWMVPLGHMWQNSQPEPFAQPATCQ